MKVGYMVAAAVAVTVIGFSVYVIGFETTEEGSLPDVGISIEDSSAPEFNVETGKPDVPTQKVTVGEPTLDIDAPDEDE